MVLINNCCIITIEPNEEKMGTRHTQKVIDENGTLKICQYGQWDGYPSGQGVEILKFLSVKSNVDALKNKLPDVRFLDKEGRDKKLVEEYNKNAPTYMSDPDKRTENQKYWFENLMHRDIGSDIYQNIINYKGDVILGKVESDWCEGFYTIDFQKNTFTSEYYDHKHTYSLDNLPTKKKYLEDMEPENEY